MNQIVGIINPDKKKMAFYKNTVSRAAKLNDIIFDGETATYSHMVWNHNGQRLTGIDITELVVNTLAERHEATIRHGLAQQFGQKEMVQQ